MWKIERIFHTMIITGCVLIFMSVIIGLTMTALNGLTSTH
jgi:hypothetical protein